MLSAESRFNSSLSTRYSALVTQHSLLSTMTTTWKGNDRIVKVPSLSLIHRLHRKVHWFETDHPDGTVSYLFPNRPMLALECVLIISLLLALFGGLSL